jgi:hypothetical protein
MNAGGFLQLGFRHLAEIATVTVALAGCRQAFRGEIANKQGRTSSGGSLEPSAEVYGRERSLKEGGQPWRW